MQKNPWLFLALGALAGGAAVAGYFVFLAAPRVPDGPRVSLANADRITPGMSESAVEAILGTPSKVETAEVPDPASLLKAMAGGKPAMKKAVVRTWQEGERRITVTFLDGKALGRTTEGLGEASKKGPSGTEEKKPGSKDAPFFAFKRLLVMPVVPPAESSPSVKAALAKLGASLPGLLKKHSDLEVILPDEAALAKGADPVEAARRLKADAVLVPTGGWQQEPRGETIWLRVDTVIHEPENVFKILRHEGPLMGRGCNLKERATHAPEIETELPGCAMAIVSEVRKAAAGRK
jgi:hypothetical protein